MIDSALSALIIAVSPPNAAKDVLKGLSPLKKQVTHIQDNPASSFVITDSRQCFSRNLR